MGGQSLEDLKKTLSNCQSKDVPGHKKEVRSLAWNCNGKLLAAGSVSNSVYVNTIDHKGHSSIKTIELKGHSASVDQVVWDPTNPDLLATASCDKTVRIWDAATGKSLQTIPTPGENINITWSPDGQYIAVGNKSDVISFICTRKWTILKSMRFTFEVNEISWNRGGDLFFLTTGLGSVEILQFPGLERVHVLQAHTANIYTIDFDPTRKYFACGSADALTSLWDTEEMMCVRTFGRLDWPVRTISFSHDGALLASGSEDPVIDIAHVETGEKVYSLDCKCAMNSIAWNPKYRLLAYTGDDVRSSGEAVVKIFGFNG